MTFEILPLMLVIFAGLGLGGFFFGGLWWTVQKGVASKLSPLWFFMSLLLRTVVVVGGFYLIANGHWQRLPLALLGFIIARSAIDQFARRFDERNKAVSQGIKHASKP